jgi:hypothetical protein
MLSYKLKTFLQVYMQFLSVIGGRAAVPSSVGLLTGSGFRVFTVSKKKGPLVSQGILKIIPDYSIDNAPPSDILAFLAEIMTLSLLTKW